MKNIIDYTLVYERHGYSFVNQIREMIKAGWQPLGGVNNYESANGSGETCQAMVKYE